MRRLSGGSAISRAASAVILADALLQICFWRSQRGMWRVCLQHACRTRPTVGAPSTNTASSSRLIHRTSGFGRLSTTMTCASASRTCLTPRWWSARWRELSLRWARFYPKQPGVFKHHPCSWGWLGTAGDRWGPLGMVREPLLTSGKTCEPIFSHPRNLPVPGLVGAARPGALCRGRPNPCLKFRALLSAAEGLS